MQKISPGTYLKCDGVTAKVVEVLQRVESYPYLMDNGLRFTTSSEIVEPDFKGFVEHIWMWDETGLSYGRNDLVQLADKYNTPIPFNY